MNDTGNLMRTSKLPLLSATLLSIALLAAANPTSSDWQLGPFTRPTNAPVITPNKTSLFTDPIAKAPIHWESLHTFNPAAIVRDNKIYVLYRAEDDTGKMQIGEHTSRLGLATSTDGITFTRLPEPVFYPAPDAQQSREWPGGVEDPRIVESADSNPDQRYVLTYTQWNRITYSIGIATSPDLQHWTKHGPAFLGASNGKYDTLKYKSGGIVTQLQSFSNNPTASSPPASTVNTGSIGAKEPSTSPPPPTSSTGHQSKIATGNPAEVLTKRPGHFDSGFPEVGPPPILTESGIVVLYNGKNDPGHGDPSLGANAYAAGEALFDAHNPAHLIVRDEAPSLKPEQPYEKTGQYVAGTTFAEGLVRFHNKWFLYYGCADSAVGVVTAP